MIFLKTNTATIITVGPFYDKTDGVTPKTGLTITNERIHMSADTYDGNAPTIILDNVTGSTTGDNALNYISGADSGKMQLALTAANLNRIGRCQLEILDAANHVPVFHDIVILPTVVFDSLFAGSDKLQVHADEITANLITAAAINDGAIDAATFAAGAINAAAIANDAIDLATFAADCKTGSALKANVETITNNAITAAAINTGAITNAKFAAGAIDAAAIANGAIDNATFAADVGSTAYATNIIALAADKAIANYDAPTATEMTAAFTEIKGATWASTDSLEAIRDKLPANLEDMSITDTTGLVDITQTAADKAWGTAARVLTANTNLNDPTAATIADAVWDEAATGHTDAGKAGQQMWTDVDAILADTGELQTNQGNWLTATGFSTHAAADVWTVGTRALTDKAGFVLSDAGVDAVWDRASSLTLSFEVLLTRAYQMINNKMPINESTGAVALRNIGDTGDIATGGVVSSSGTTTRSELSWS